MNFLVKCFILLISLAIGNWIYIINKQEAEDILPSDTYWGPASPSRSEGEDASIKPFKINVQPEVLANLKTKLQNHEPLTSPLEGIQQQYGINTKLVDEIVEFWLNKYNWKEREQFLNQYPQYKTKIQGLDIHFIRVKPSNVPKNVRVLPLLMLHGWPGSVREFYEVIPLLTDVSGQHGIAFEVIVPSLPGYGFSQAAAKPGLSYKHISVIFNNLMKRLGFEQYYVHGTDWGSAIATDMGKRYSNHVKGVHSTMCFSNNWKTHLKHFLGSIYPRLVVDKKHEHRLYPLSKFFSHMLLEFGYMHLQATKPDTVGVALTDSPVGLAAYILEKFSSWTKSEWQNRPNGGLSEKFTPFQLIDNIMIYWITNSITTSMRLYSESINSKQNIFTESFTVTTPTACAVFENDLMYQTESFIRDKYLNLIHIKEYDAGHFAGLEIPDVLAKDIFLAVVKMEKL